MKTEPDPAGEGTRAESVSEFTRRVKLLLESGLRPSWIRGEVSNLRAQASGHVYFSLKDAGAQLSAVLFRGDAARQEVKLRDGLQVIVYGEVSVYEARGQYQLIVRVPLSNASTLTANDSNPHTPNTIRTIRPSRFTRSPNPIRGAASIERVTRHVEQPRHQVGANLLFSFHNHHPPMLPPSPTSAASVPDPTA